MPAPGHVEEQKICPIIEIVIESVALIEGDGTVYGMVIEPSFHMDVLIGDDILGMIEIDLESPAFLFIQQETQPVIVLGDGDRFLEQAFVPSFMIMGVDAGEGVVVAKERLGYVKAAMCIPFRIIAPGDVYFFYKVFLFF